MPDSPRELGTYLFDLEKQLLQPSTRRDSAALSSLLAEDFREFGSSGRVYNRQQIIHELATEQPRSITMSDTSCQPLAEDIVLLTYRSIRTIAPHVASHALRSSLWVRRKGSWQILFHQGTPISVSL